ncbi:MAG: DUF721 domain-containing protein [Microcystaceae cyanobacterium]
MSFQSLNRLLLKLQQQPAWENHQQYLSVMQAWQQVVEPDLFSQTKPLAIRNQILWVATATSVLAQNLTLQRYPLVKALNTHLESPLRDLRYSTAHWNLVQKADAVEETTQGDRRSYPEFLDLTTAETPPAKTPLEAFQRWARVVETRRSQLPLCPCCEGPTHPQELERWSMCGNCISRTWKS